MGTDGGTGHGLVHKSLPKKATTQTVGLTISKHKNTKNGKKASKTKIFARFF
jgi:hypothetical protein